LPGPTPFAFYRGISTLRISPPRRRRAEIRGCIVSVAKRDTGKAPNEVAELVIGHKRQGVEAVYDLHRFDAEKRQALEAWSQKLMSIVGAA
jgi:hypothetical protein